MKAFKKLSTRATTYDLQRGDIIKIGGSHYMVTDWMHNSDHNINLHLRKWGDSFIYHVQLPCNMPFTLYEPRLYLNF